MDKKRFGIQAAATLLQNANFKGFFTGKIYTGAGKNVCVPGINCYSCPGAVGACPLGSLQGFLSSRPIHFPYYVLGLLIFFGAVLGRLVCGFLCPFGFLQELLHKIPFPKKIKTFRGDRVLRYLKYILLALTVTLPLFFALTPFFCKYVCPAGTVAGALLAAADARIRPLLGRLFARKLFLLILIVILSLMIYRPFCRYICPLGAFYGLFNRFSLYGEKLDADKCAACGKCANVCPMAVDPIRNADSRECIRCGKCADICPTGAVQFGWKFKKQ